MLRYVELLEREAQLLTPDLVGSRHPDVRTLPPLPVAHDGGAEGPVAQGCPPRDAQPANHLLGPVEVAIDPPILADDRADGAAFAQWNLMFAVISTAMQS